MIAASLALAIGWALVAWEVLDPAATRHAPWRALIRRFSGFDNGDLAPIWPADATERTHVADTLRSDLSRSVIALGLAGLLVAGGLGAIGSSLLVAIMAGAPLWLAAIQALRERGEWARALQDDAADPVRVTRLVRLMRLRLTLTRLIGAPLGLGLTANAALAGHAVAPWVAWSIAILALVAALYRALYRP
jgi:hypothetical protein